MRLPNVLQPITKRNILMSQLTVTIFSFHNVLEPVLVEIAEKARVATVSKVNGTYFRFKAFGNIDRKGTTVGLSIEHGSIRHSR